MRRKFAKFYRNRYIQYLIYAKIRRTNFYFSKSGLEANSLTKSLGYINFNI